MMNKASSPRPPPIPASPHLKQPMVVMVNEDGRSVGGRQPWPPVRTLPGAPRPHDFLTKYANEGGIKVTWPPHLGSHEDLTNDQEGAEPHSHHGGQFHPHQSEGGHHHGSSPLPAGFKLREEAPMDHVVPPPLVPAQPAFKITQPVRMRADDKWPPKKGHGGQDETHSNVREFVKPSKGNRDYTEFFAENALPSSWPSYRAPPGTQHHGIV